VQPALAKVHQLVARLVDPGRRRHDHSVLGERPRPGAQEHLVVVQQQYTPALERDLHDRRCR
jgi:hypothetical protein